jgi:hypothetical protein
MKQQGGHNLAVRELEQSQPKPQHFSHGNHTHQQVGFHCIPALIEPEL